MGINNQSQVVGLSSDADGNWRAGLWQHDVMMDLNTLDLEIHLPEEGHKVSKNARSQAKLIHGIHVVLARNYIENLREEVKKGMREKTERGIYPNRPHEPSAHHRA